jgi:hypothetical protein
LIVSNPEKAVGRAEPQSGFPATLLHRAAGERPERPAA